VWQEWEAQKQVNTPALCAKVLNNVVAGVRRDPAAAPAIPRDGIMAMRAAGMRFNALKHISRAKNSVAGQAEGSRLLDEALAAERGAARGDEKLLARAQRRAQRLELLRTRGMLSPGDIACYRTAPDGGNVADDPGSPQPGPGAPRATSSAGFGNEASATAEPAHKGEMVAEENAAQSDSQSAPVVVPASVSERHRGPGQWPLTTESVRATVKIEVSEEGRAALTIRCPQPAALLRVG
jgi:hypothetical protein